ncbi:MAG: hypothetical protein ACREP6_05050 [Candidatus Binataceae bacterium]
MQSLQIDRIRELSLRLAFALVIAACAGIAGCAEQDQPPQIMVTPLGEYTRPARAPGCKMPLLQTEPARNYQQVAIVEGWGALDQGPQVETAARKEACQTGADALMLVSAARQKVVKNLYAATPNTESEKTNGASMRNQQGQYIHQKEYKPTAGEAGYTGFYLDAVAIIFDKNNGGQGAVASGAAPGN